MKIIRKYIKKLKPASSNYSDCNFSAKSNNFYKITIIGGFNNFVD